MLLIFVLLKQCS